VSAGADSQINIRLNLSNYGVFSASVYQKRFQCNDSVCDTMM